MKLRNVRRRQKARYRRKHYEYMRKHHAKLRLTRRSYGFKISERNWIKGAKLYRWMKEAMKEPVE